MVTLDGYILDATISEEVVYESEVTDHPVETGADVSDNIRAKPLIYNLEAIVSDTPRGAIRDDPTRTNAGTAPSKDAYNRFVAIQANKKLIVILSDRFGKLINMALVRLSPPVTKDTGRALHFTATFKQITFVTNNRSTVRVAVPSTAPTTNKGNLPTQPGNTGLQPIYVISVPISARPQYSKIYGAPVFTRVQFNNEGSAAFNQLDCYNVAGTAAKPDGYLTRGDEGLYTYVPLANTSGAATANLKPTINGEPVHYDYADRTWRDDSSNNVVRTVPQGQDRWNGVSTGSAPSPGTGGG